MSIFFTRYSYNRKRQYQLTKAQEADGWVVRFSQYCVRYLHNGLLENPAPNIPAVKFWHDNGRLADDLYYQNGLRQNPNHDTPAIQMWGSTGQLERVEYRKNDVLQDPNPETPALSHWHENGQLATIQHCQNGVVQDPDEKTPACKQWNKNGQLWAKRHYQNGLLHDPNFHTPAYREWDSAGQVKEVVNCCQGIPVPREFWQWTIKDALNTGNLEQRRVWFETNGGWEEFEKEFELVDEKPDPANDGFTLRLCKFPTQLDVYNGQARIIFCNNASLDLDGSRRRYALVVPDFWGKDALGVVARSFGLTSKEYSTLKVAK